MTVHERAVGATVEWYTPRSLFVALGLEFDLDPASPRGGPVPWVPAAQFYSPVEDGLAQPWAGRVWLNPPYGPAGRHFMARFVEHRHGVALVAARTETRWFQESASTADRVCFLRERIWHVRSDGYQARAPFGSALIAYGRDCARALDQASLGMTISASRATSEGHEAFQALGQALKKATA